jgi:hypothetical protein
MSEFPVPDAWQPPAPGEAPETSEAVVVGCVHDSKVSYSWHHSMMQLLGWDWANKGRIHAGGYISIKYGTDGLIEARNRAVRDFLAERKGDWLWWVDTDMGFAPDTVDRLFAAAHPVERPIVGGLCFSQRELEPDGLGGHVTGPVPTIYRWTQHKGQSGFAVMWDYPPDTLVKCHGTGSACILIHRSVFERIGERFGPVWYDRALNPSTGQMISEDLSLCIRAGALDIPIFVHTGVPTTHHKEVWLSERDYWRARAVDPPPAEPEPDPAPVAQEVAQ